MPHTVTTTEFEGPLAVLLELVERKKLEVTSISIAAITADYIRQVEAMTERSPEHLSDFLQLGARLLYIKSLALLPRADSDEQAEELRQLNLELDEYRRYQQAAHELARLSSGKGSWERPVVSRLAPHELPLPELSLGQLAEAFQRALRQVEPTTEKRLLRPPISQESVMRSLRRQLSKGAIQLQSVLDKAEGRLEVIVTFLAVLELIKLHELRVVQDGQFGAMVMEPIA